MKMNEICLESKRLKVKLSKKLFSLTVVDKKVLFKRRR